MQVQHGVLQSCSLDLGLPQPDFMRLWQAAADEERQEALFGPLLKCTTRTPENEARMEALILHRCKAPGMNWRLTSVQNQ
jgi:hypothetical protein